MAQVAPVELPYSIKTLWFDPNGLEISNDDKLVVQTSRGLELGRSVGGVIEVSDESVETLKTKLQPVVRIATDEDIKQAEEMDRRSHEAMSVFKEMARQHNEDIHPVSVEFMLDGDKAIFYFESEERIDFRNLVRDLAAHFHVRIDMRQIGVRDEARIVGGIAHCGQVVCCKRLGGEFKPVSIRMAKNQDLSLNPKKISGLCGRLMCCLRYEDDVYKEFKQISPKVGAQVVTPEGDGKVVELNVPKKTVSVKVGDNKPVAVPLDAISDISENQKSCAINEEQWQKANEQASLVMFGGTDIFDFSTFTGEDKLGKAVAVHNESHKRDKDKDKDRSSAGKHRQSRKRRSGQGSKGSGEGSTEQRNARQRESQEVHHERKPRRRSTKIQAGSSKTETIKSDHTAGNNAEKDSRAQSMKAKSSKSGQSDRQRKGANKGSSTGKNAKQSSGHLRPGHKSSGLAHEENASNGSQANGSRPSGNNGRRRRRVRPSNPSKGTE